MAVRRALVVVVTCLLIQVVRCQNHLASLLQRDQANGLSLQQVVGVLKQRGMLTQIDPNLLERIEAKLGTNLVTVDKSPQEIEEQRRNKELSFLEKARLKSIERRQSLFGTRPTTTRPTSRPRSSQRESPLFSLNSLKDGGECQALKTENRLLKQQLLKQRKEEQQKPTTAIDVLRQLQDKGLFEEHRSFEASDPLENLLAESSVQQPVLSANRLVEGEREVRSVLITPTPTMSTIVKTVSFTETVTKNITQEINILLHGRKIPTYIVDTEVVVQTSSSVASTEIEVTPTPTWQYITVTPTITLPPPPPPPTPPPVDFQALLQQKEKEKLELIKRIQSLQTAGSRIAPTFGGVKAEVVEIPEKLDSFSSLQHYLEKVRQLKAQNSQTILAQPLIQEAPAVPVTPTQTLPEVIVSTVYLSGSIPGEYSTSLVTVTNTQNLGRYRRDTDQDWGSPTIISPVSTQQVELQGSFSSPVPEYCEPSTVTVTVTAPPTMCSP